MYPVFGCAEVCMYVTEVGGRDYTKTDNKKIAIILFYAILEHSTMAMLK